MKIVQNMFSTEQLQALRDWVRSELDFAIAKNEDGSDGYMSIALFEGAEADRCFEELTKALVMEVRS